MWLLNSSTLELKEFFGHEIPKYAILSHTWSKDGEIRFHEMQNATATIMETPGYKKVKSFCQLAKDHKYDWAWIDSACIDKHSSAELTESLNSMYTFYRNAQVCMIYLSDVEPIVIPDDAGTPQHSDRARYSGELKQSKEFKDSNWFNRGWTLQELIANPRRMFLAKDWTRMDMDMWHKDALSLCEEVTGIRGSVLRDPIQLRFVCISERMSWASRRVTTRPEDGAYSLMGLFDCSMPVLYGEGLRKAFRRLQDEILKKSFDQTLFAWRGQYDNSGLLARTPADFMDSPKMALWAPERLSPCSVTNVGVHINSCVYKGRTNLPSDTIFAALQCLVLKEDGWAILFITLKRKRGAKWFMNGGDLSAFRRVNCDTFTAIPNKLVGSTHSEYQELLVLEDEHSELVNHSALADRMRMSEKRYATKGQTMKLGDS